MDLKFAIRMPVNKESRSLLSVKALVKVVCAPLVRTSLVPRYPSNSKEKKTDRDPSPHLVCHIQGCLLNEPFYFADYFA
jgi:hypothetical protein